MDKSQQEREEMNMMVEQLEHEVSILSDASKRKGTDLDREYSNKVIRAQLHELADLIETMSTSIGEGEAISVTRVPIKERDKEE